MKKNMSRIIAIGIGLSVMGGSMVPVFAAENTANEQNISSSILTSDGNYIILNDSIIYGQATSGKQLLTLNKTITAAIDNSDKLALKTKQIKMYRDKMDLQDKTNNFYDIINQKVYDFPYDKLELQEKQTKQSKDFLQDQIANDITNKYNAIIMKQMDINKSKINLEIKIKELDAMKTKVRIGMATKNQLDDKEIEIKSLEDYIRANEDSLKNNIDYLGVLTELNISNYALDSSINYESFKIDGSVDEYLDKKIDTYLKYNEEMIDLTNDYFKELKEDGIKDIIIAGIPSIPNKNNSEFTVSDAGNISFDYGKYALALIEYQQEVQSFSNKLTAYGSYLDNKYSIDEAQVKLEDSKKALKNGLRESYSTLLELENKISRLNEQIKSMNTKLRYAKSQVDMGMMTENNYKAMVLKSEDLNISMRNLINTYNNLESSIQNPWILNNN